MRQSETRWNRAASMVVVACLVLACQAKEIDTKAFEDPLDDPWVAGLGTEDGAAEAQPELAVEPSPEPAPELPEAAETEGPAEAENLEAAPSEAAPEDAPAQPGTPTAASSAKTPSSNSTAQPSKGTSPEAPAEAAPAPVEPAPVEPAPAELEPAEAKPVETKPAEPPPITLADFAGTYRYTGGNAQREALAATIEDTILQLNVAIRGIGRKRLTKTNPIDDTLQIVITGDKVKTIFSVSGFDAECTIGAAPISYTGKSGDKYKVKVVQQGSKLVQIIAGDDGVKTTVFVLSSDRQRLTVNHKVTADRLQTPMTYKLSFTRK